MRRPHTTHDWNNIEEAHWKTFAHQQTLNIILHKLTTEQKHNTEPTRPFNPDPTQQVPFPQKSTIDRSCESASLGNFIAQKVLRKSQDSCSIITLNCTIHSFIRYLESRIFSLHSHCTLLTIHSRAPLFSNDSRTKKRRYTNDIR